MRKKIVVASFLAVSMLVCVSALSAGGSRDTSGSQKTKVSLSTVIPPGTSVPLGLENMAKTLNESGKFEAAVFPGSQLGALVDVMDRCLAGDPLIMTCGPGEMADLGVRDMSATQIPFFYTTWEQADKVTTSDWYKDLVAQVEKKGMKILASNWGFGDRHILTKTPITKLSDLAGKKIRVPNNVNHVRGLNSLGAAATPMALAEVFTALQQGVIDGMENPYADIYANKMHEVGKYIVEDDHLKELCLIICGTKFFDSLDAEQQELLLKQAEESGKYQRAALIKSNEEAKEKLKAEGVIFTRINRDEFIQAVNKNYYSYYTSEWTPGVQNIVRDLVNK
jgi:tripartite ATP-independent transporter DctP family solute receptor